MTYKIAQPIGVAAEALELQNNSGKGISLS
jgi:hypothetical protein